MANSLREFKLIAKQKGLIKEIIKKQLSRKFYKYLKNHDGKYYVDNIEYKNYQEINENANLLIQYEAEEDKAGHVEVNKPLEIIYEDEEFIVVNKPSHLLSIPTYKENDAVFNRLLAYFHDTNYFPHIMTRLDEDTNGLVLVAKDRLSCCLTSDITKKYIAITNNKLKDDRGLIELNIKRSDDSIKRMVASDGKVAKTLYQFIKEKDGLYYYDVTLLTGRTHQIRVHFSHLASPLIGDKLYGNDDNVDLGLQCYYLKFINPITKKEIEIELS